MKGLTGTQGKVLQFVKDYLVKNGYPPTVREIGTHFGILWPAARQHLKSLARKGFLRINPAKSRGIEITGFSLVGELMVPVVGRIRAGKPDLAIEDIDMHIRVDAALFPANDSFSLRVAGDSMIEAGILDGDFVIVKRQNTIDSGEIGVAIIGDEATVKRILFDKGRVILKPENKTMEPASYDAGDVIIAGKVIGLIRSRM